MTSFTKIIIKVGNHKKYEIGQKISLNVCSSLKYSINTINKKHLNIPRCRINPKKKDLETLHVVPWVLLSGLKAHGPWISQPLEGLGHG